MTPDQKACQEAFEKWVKKLGTGHCLEIKWEGSSQNPYAIPNVFYTYEAWRNAWQNRTEALRRDYLGIGDFRILIPSWDMENQGKIWLQRDGGEGGTFDIKEFEAAIEAFFVERM